MDICHAPNYIHFVRRHQLTLNQSIRPSFSNPAEFPALLQHLASERTCDAEEPEMRRTLETRRADKRFGDEVRQGLRDRAHRQGGSRGDVLRGFESEGRRKHSKPAQ